MRKFQRGFALTATQVALISVVLITGATMYTLEESRQRANDSRAHVNASYLLKTSSDMKWAINRAIVDSNIKQYQVSQVLGFTDESSVNLFDKKLNYGIKPVLPKGLVIENMSTAGKFYWDQQYPNIIAIDGIELDVCRRFNELLQGASYDKHPPVTLEFAYKHYGWQQGCYSEYNSEYGTWYMDVFATEQCVGTDCKSMDVEGFVVRKIYVDQESLNKKYEQILDIAGQPIKSEVEKLTDCVNKLVDSGEKDVQQIGITCRNQVDLNSWNYQE